MKITNYIIDIKDTSLNDRLKLKQVLLDNGYLEKAIVVDNENYMNATTCCYNNEGWLLQFRDRLKPNITLQDFIAKFGKPQPKYELDTPFGYYGQNYPLYYVACSKKVNERVGMLAKNGTIIFPDYGSDTHITQCCWSTVEEANQARAKYLGEQMEPEIKIGSHWSYKYDNTYVVTVTRIDSYNNSIYYKDTTSCHTDIKWFLENYKPRPDLDTQATVHSDVEPTSTIKETTMNKTTLKLLLALMGATTQETKDATNSNYIGIITNSNDEYLGYVYADTVKELKEIIAKPSNESNTIHIFKFADSYKQAARPVVKLARATSTVEDTE